MADKISDVVTLFNEMKSEKEQQRFIKAQFETITKLVAQNEQLSQEVTHLKNLLDKSSEFVNILSPEEGLVDGQIKIIQERSIGAELSLEDVKKLDILLKNKKLLKEEPETFKAEYKKLNILDNKELFQIAKKSNEPQ